MVMILLRHGEAEARESDRSDAERMLTNLGRKRLRKALPALRKLIAPTSKLKIWTSPLTRAIQTAELAADCFDVDSAEVHEALETGDFSEFIQSVRGLDPGSSLMLVGHEPILSTWSDRLCGFSLPFKKGAAAAILLDSQDWVLLSQEDSLARAQGQLLWFIQPKPMRKLRGR
jgi:phosphohistidine phosphatase